MTKLFVSILVAFVAAATAEPYIVGAPLVPPAAAALVAPAAETLVGPATAAVVAPTGAGYARLAAPSVPFPYSAVSAYSYGSSYNIQDYYPALLGAPAALTYNSPYNAYATEWFYKR